MAVLTVIAMSCTGRSLAVLLLVLGDRRSLAPYCCCLAREQRLVGYCWLAGRSLAASACRTCHHSGAHDLFPDCLASLRPSECSGVEMQPAKLKRSGMERLQSWRVSRVRGRNRADIWRVGSGSALAPVRDQAQVSAR
jgi:hypothetical protein